jgi:hypothetical protein
MIILCYIYLKKYSILRKIDLPNDSVVESASKVNRFKLFTINSQKYVLIAYPFMTAGILLMGWKGFHFDNFTIFLMLGVVLFAISLGQKRYKANNLKIEKLNADILELQEYKD